MSKPKFEPGLIEKPYPLLRNFAFYVLPLLLIGVVGLSFSLRETIATSIEAFQAESDRNNATFVIKTAFQTDTSQWRALIDGSSQFIAPTITSEFGERGIFCMSIQTAAGKTIYAGSVVDRCKVPTPEAFDETVESGLPELQENIAYEGYWTTLMSLRDPGGGPDLLVAISRPSGGLERTVGNLTNTRTLLFGSVFLLACGFALWLVYRAQGRLQMSFDALNRARIAMEPFLSKSARENALLGKPAATRHNAVVMFADLRNFSGFAETAPIESTADLLDSFVSITTEAVERHGGEVDKHLGDGILAWFRGEHANDRSIKAAIDCINGCRGLDRRPGIGLFRGEVVAASLGHGDRMDFTILGRVVNLASRLCSSAKEGEIAAPADFEGFDDNLCELVRRETVNYKNHTTPIVTHHYKLRQTDGMN